MESAQRSLEEERRALSKEREDLERAKVRMIYCTSSSEVMCSMPVVTFSLIPLSASERHAGGAEVSDGALHGREEEAGCRVGQLSQRREAETRAGGEGQQSAGEERERHHHSGKRNSFTFVTLFAILRLFGQICSDWLDWLCINMCCDVGTS